MFYSLFASSLSKVIDSKLKEHISHWFTTYHLTGLQRVFLQDSWRVTEVVTSPGRYWQTSPAALTQMIYYKPCWVQGLKGTHQFKDHKSGWQRGFIKLFLTHQFSFKFDAVWKERWKNSRHILDPDLKKYARIMKLIQWIYSHFLTACCKY